MIDSSLFYILYVGFMAYVVLDIIFIYKLRKNRIFKTRKGTYTWTPKEDIKQ